jgi:hypothetical protein
MKRCMDLIVVFVLLLAGTASAEQPPAGQWKSVRTLAASEAHQAAAATNDAVFAISSTQVAKYDRTSGQRIAVSRGPAQHLNSGFIHEGRLYAAHSNYPRQPERSEIKVLDLASLELTTFHDFGDFGGSLTWAVRHDGHWWCNFARYGAKNAETFLVRFDDAWRERGRWTYPPEIIRQIGLMSLSGGLWRDGLLLATDHDHGRLYRLRVPAGGTVLEYAGEEVAPFTGQGIAADPATGGLVGINRAKRQIVFAEFEAAQKKPAENPPVPKQPAAAKPPQAGRELAPLAYNHPGLTVDLGVGLWAWPVPCDADGDGDFDLIVSCPDKPSNGVWLFENRAGNTAEHKMPVFQPARRLSSTVHYVMPSYAGGKLRVLSPGMEYPRFTAVGLAEKVKLPIDPKFHRPIGTQPKGPKVRHNQWRYADYDGDAALDLVVGIEDWSDYGWDDAWSPEGVWQNGPLHGWVYWFRNEATTEKPRYAKPQRIETEEGKLVETFGCPSPNFEDFDGDGDLDLLCGEFLDGFTYFENVGARTKPRYAAGRKLPSASGGRLAMDLEMIVPVAFDWDKDGDFDLIVGDEDGRVALVENTGKLASDRTPQFAMPRYFQQLADTLKCGALATPVGCDWDGDGDTDILAGNTAGYIELFENLSSARVASPEWNAPRKIEVEGEPLRIMAGPSGSIQGPAEAKWGYTTLNVADWDGDRLPDIVFNSIWGKVEWLRNIGTRSQPRFAAPRPIEVEWNGPTPKPAWTWWQPEGKQLVTQWRTTPLVYDFTGDGLADLAMLDQEGYLTLFERVTRGDQRVLLPPRRAFVDEKRQPLRLNSQAAGRSGRRKLCVTDWDGDGRFDLLLNSANADLLRQVAAEDGRWVFQNAGTLAQANIEGHDVSPATVDFEGDGIPDFLGGAEDGRFYFLKNPRSP